MEKVEKRLAALTRRAGKIDSDAEKEEVEFMFLLNSMGNHHETNIHSM